MDQFVEVSRQGWLSRIGNSVMGSLLGLVLVAVSFWLLWWNEGRAVERADSIAAGAAAVVSVSADAVDADNEGALVHLCGMLATGGEVADPDFGVSGDGVRLRRQVEVYEWDEHVETKKKKNLGGSETTKKTYTYTEQWSEQHTDSARFEHARGHHNPEPPFETKTFNAPDVKVGAYSLPDPLVRQYDDFSESIPATAAMVASVSSTYGRTAKVSGDMLYVGDDPSHPEVGDLRVTFVAAKPGTVSVLGAQRGSSVEAWHEDGNTLESRLEVGSRDAESMFEQLDEENAQMTWLLRAVGFAMMFIGFTMILRPLSVVSDVIPLIGSIVGFGAAIAAFLVSATLSLGTIAVAWVRFRPLVGVPLLLVSTGFGYLLLRRSNKKAG